MLSYTVSVALDHEEIKKKDPHIITKMYSFYK